MILGISSFTYGWSIGVDGYASRLNEQDLIRQTMKFGLTCLQLGDNLPLHTLPHSRLTDLKRAAAENKVRLEVGARKLTEDHLHRYIDIAVFLQAPFLRFVIDENDYEPESKTIISILRNVLLDLRKYKITLGIENHDRFKSRELAKIMESISDEHVGICLDCVNSIGAGEGLEWVTDMLAPYTVNLHIKDFSIQRFSHKMGFTVAGTEAGKGMLDLPWVMEKLVPYQRCQSAILEQWVPPEEQLDDTIKKEYEWADQGIRYLKQLPYFKNTLS